MSKLTWLLTVLLLCCMALPGHTKVGDWTTLTNTNFIRDLQVQGGDLWCATSGGLLRIDIVTGAVRIYTNVDGLSSVDVLSISIDRLARGLEPVLPPTTTMLGGLLRYLREADPSNFQPMNANFGLVDPLAENVRGKRPRREELAARAIRDVRRWVDSLEASGAAANP